MLGRNHQFDPDDKGAVYIWDTVESAELVDQIFTSMTAFLGAIAVVTLTLGGVGVHEHHAGLGDGAHARDRTAQSGRARPAGASWPIFWRKA